MKSPNYDRTRRSCFFAYLAMSSVFSLPPMLFVTFHEMYDISYTLQGTLLLLNFCTQLLIDLIFSFFSQHFNLRLTIRLMPLLTATGLFLYAFIPMVSPANATVGLIVGTLLFSVAAGLCEVLLSPLVASLPSEHPDKDMSLLHSLYGWGVVSVVLISSAFFKIFGTENWTYLTFFWAALPLVASLLFWLSPIPETENTPAEKQTVDKTGRSRKIILCMLCIFLGSATENAMTGWISSFMENALLIPKAVGDILGMAVFAILLAVARNLYAKFGKNISKTLLVSMACAILCYLVAGAAPGVIVPFIGCILTGLCTSMLWPGTLIMMEENIPHPGIAVYALMAAGGDLGASFAPQVLGIIVDKVSASDFAAGLCEKYTLTPDQVGLKIGMLIATVFPALGTILLLYIRKALYRDKKQKEITAKSDPELPANAGKR